MSNHIHTGGGGGGGGIPTGGALLHGGAGGEPLSHSRSASRTSREQLLRHVWYCINDVQECDSSQRQRIELRGIDHAHRIVIMMQLFTGLTNVGSADCTSPLLALISHD